MAEMGSVTDIRVGIFFVHRKDDMLRMIVDPKITNLICREPPYTALPGTSNLAEMECLPSQQLTFASGDVDCCYFQYRLPTAMRSLFGLPMVEKRFFDPDLQRLPEIAVLHAQDMVPLRLIVTPMGWAWSVFFVQLGQTNWFSLVLPQASWMSN